MKGTLLVIFLFTMNYRMRESNQGSQYGIVAYNSLEHPDLGCIDSYDFNAWPTCLKESLP